MIGVGGGGSNAVNRMLQSDLQGVEFWILNTDSQVWQVNRSSYHRLFSMSHIKANSHAQCAGTCQLSNQSKQQIANWREADQRLGCWWQPTDWNSEWHLPGVRIVSAYAWLQRIVNTDKSLSCICICQNLSQALTHTWLLTESSQ